MDIKEILSKIYVDAGIDPDHRIASDASGLTDGITMLTLKRCAEKYSVKGEIAAKLCFCGSYTENADKNGCFALGAELLRDCYGKINCFIAPTFDVKLFNATASILKSYRKDIRVTAVSFGSLPEGIDLALIDEAVCVSESDASEMAKDIYETEQLVAGPMSGASLKTAIGLAHRINDHHVRIVVLFPDIS